MGPGFNAIITGATSRVGSAIAIKIASTGAAVCLAGRDTGRLEAIAAKVTPTARATFVYKADLTDDSAVKKLAEQLHNEFGNIDLLVHSAGAYSAGPIESTDVKELDVLYKTNVRLPCAVTQALLPLMRVKRGQIVFMNSSQGLEAKASTAHYALTQHALKAFADALRQEVNAKGIRVLSVYLGRTATARMEAIYKAEGREYRPELLLQPEDVAEIVMASLQLPRTAEVTNLEIRPAIKSY